MIKFIFKLFWFVIPILFYCISSIILTPFIISQIHGPSTEQQIRSSFKNVITEEKYDLIILGNSRTYRGLNPEFFDFNTFNFSHDNDNYNQIFYKLKFLLQENIQFDYLILGTDYFQFNYKSGTRNYIYGDLLSNEYLEDYEEDNKIILKLEHYINTINPRIFLNLPTISIIC